MAWRLGMAVVVLLLVFAGCASGDGSGDSGSEVQRGLAESAAGDAESGGTGDDVETATIAPTESDAAEESDGADTSVADDTDDSSTPTVPDDLPIYHLEPVHDDDDAQSVHALLLDLHGPTDDVAAQVNRLTSFPGVPTPDGGVVITEVSTLQDPADPADVTDLSSILSSTRVSFYSTASPEELFALYEGAYGAWGYTNVKTTEESTDAAISTTLMLEFGEELGRPKAEVKITDEADTELTLVRIDHRERIDGGDRYVELAEWSSPYVPNGASLTKVQIGTSYIKLATVISNQIQIEARWDVEGDQDETTAIVQELAAASGVDHETNSTGAALFTGPNERIDLTGNNGSIGVDIIYPLDDLVGRVETIG